MDVHHISAGDITDCESGNDCESVHHISVGDSYFMNGSTQTDSPEHFDVGTQTPLSFTKPV